MTIAQEYQIERLKEQVAELKAKPHRQQFARAFSDKLGLLAAARPYDKWTHVEKIAFASAAKEFPTLAMDYKAHLPKTD
jgi:hypothetical protein